MLDLQQSHGNRFVRRAVQAKLDVSQPGDPSEREADRIAGEIMRMPAPRPVQLLGGAPVQRCSGGQLCPA